MNKYCGDRRSVPVVTGGSDLFRTFSSTNVSRSQEVETVTGWAMVDAMLQLVEPVPEDNETAVLRDDRKGHYIDTLAENLANCVYAWLGGYPEKCDFVKKPEKNHSECACGVLNLG